MLILTREIGESITILLDEERSIEIKLFDIQRKFGKIEAVIGLDAPRDISIFRNELKARAFNQ